MIKLQADPLVSIGELEELINPAELKVMFVRSVGLVSSKLGAKDDLLTSLKQYPLTAVSSAPAVQVNLGDKTEVQLSLPTVVPPFVRYITILEAFVFGGTKSDGELFIVTSLNTGLSEPSLVNVSSYCTYLLLSGEHPPLRSDPEVTFEHDPNVLASDRFAWLPVLTLTTSVVLAGIVDVYVIVPKSLPVLVSNIFGTLFQLIQMY